MHPQPEAGEYRGVRYFRSPSEPELFFYLPSGPGPERDSQGRPTLLLVHSPPRSSLQLGSRWEVAGDVLEDMREHLGSRFGINPVLINLRPAPFEVESVALGLGNGEGAFQELQRNKSSNYAPLSAVFQANLDSDQSARAISALTGHKGYLAVTWRGALSVPGQAPRTVEQTTDVSDWFPSNSGLEHMMSAASPVQAASPVAPAAGPVEVSCDFDAADAPVGAVEIRSSSGTAHLAPPRLAPARIEAAPGERLRVKTVFTKGGAAYESESEPVSGRTCSLRPGNLGLAMVTVDATARRRAGATSMQLRISYTPRGDGVADETLVRFRYGEWVARWFVITRSAELNGSLDYSITEVSADGSAAEHPPVKTEDTHLQL